jgi:CBS domain-containing protein
MNPEPTRNANSGTTALEIRARRTARADGSIDTKLTANCERQGHSVPIEQCLNCPQCEGLRLATSGAEAFVRCAFPPDDEIVRLALVVGESARAELTKLSEIMTNDVLCVTADVLVDDIATMLLDRNFSAVPVVDGAGRPIGIVSKTDLLRDAASRRDTNETERLTRQRRGVDVELGDGFHLDSVVAPTAAEIMMPLSFSLPEHASVARASALMATEGVHRLPVVSENDGTVVGIVSAIDVLRFVAQTQGYLITR